MGQGRANSGSLPISVLIAYGLPGLPLAAVLLPLYVYLPTFYARELGLGLATVGAVLLAARLWDVISDPLIGALSDRFSTRWGRRRPWLLLATPLVLVSAWYLFIPGAPVGWFYLLAWTMALTLGGTMLMLPYTAWGAELSPDYHERSRVAGAREGFVVCGTLLAAAMPQLLGGGAGPALAGLAWGLAVVLPLAVLVAWHYVPDGTAARTSTIGARRAVQTLYENGPFRRLIAAYFVNGVANGLPATLFLLFVGHALQAPEWAGGLLFIYFACGVAAIPAWLLVSRRIGKHRTWAAAMGFACAVFVLVPLLGPGDVWWFLAICVLTGLTLGADLTLPPSMQADVVDLDTLRSGQRRAGIFFALWGMATKLALALGVGIAFPLLDLAGFSAGASRNSEFALFSLAALYSLAPVAFKLGAIALVWGYPITAQEQRRIRDLIENRSGALQHGSQRLA